MPGLAYFLQLVVMTGLLILSTPIKAAAEERQQVSFSDVTALSYTEPSEVLTYGHEPGQFIERWQSLEPNQDINMILVHGGCWLNAYGVDHVRAAATDLFQRGYSVSAIEYRRLGDDGGGWPNSKNDIVTALNLIYERHQTPKAQFIIVGHSAGGHLALLAAEELNYKPEAVVGLAPITNLAEYASDSGSCQSAGAQFLATAAKSEQHAVNVLENSELNRLLFYGSEDAIVPSGQTQSGFSETVLIDQAGHFDFVHPQTSAWNQWVSHLTDYIRP